MAQHQSDLKHRETRLRATVHRLVAAISNIGNQRDGGDALQIAIDIALNETWFAHRLLTQCQRGQVQ